MPYLPDSLRGALPQEDLERFETEGPESTRMKVEAGIYSGATVTRANAWLNAVDREAERAAAKDERERAKQAIDAAERAANGSMVSAKWAKRAAIFTAIGSFAAATGIIVTLYHKDGPQKVIVQVQIQPQPSAKPAALKPHPKK